MGIETHTCIVVLCDECGDDWYTNGVRHYETLADAYTSLVTQRNPDPEDVLYDPYVDDRWQIEDGKPVLCSTCAAAQRCAEEGHPWGGWNEHPTGLASIRTCERCGKVNTNISELVEQMAGEGAPDA